MACKNYPILINIQQKRGLIYDAEDYFTLRLDHRIVGNLIGIPVSYPRKVNQQGLPAVLSCYELLFLLEKNVVRLVDKNAAFMAAPTDSQTERYLNITQQQKEELRKPAIEKRLESFRRHLPRIIEGKRQKLIKSGHNLEGIIFTPESLLQDERDRLAKEPFDVLLQLPTKHPLEVGSSFLPLQLSAEETLKFRVFKALWTEGGYITVGDAFGCDFLLYPDDPLYFHASHMVHVLKEKRKRLDVKYLIRICRLAIVVNKLCVIAYLDDRCDIVVFETLEWEGNVNKTDST
ncbi:tRNA-splicing endonuclease subunit Sen34-like isoform X2 [Anopheles albimanus]|uniref:tRNA-splicing endonuclease subunit Sen34-like isoform X2 n=1 Tax=Anopheles albimanus TaxID=7167 RepID=UPI00164006E3|nr:tRNA-splicing endonuclease subunit Sen34-like isoform X2 [Anopheles albimanus]